MDFCSAFKTLSDGKLGLERINNHPMLELTKERKALREKIIFLKNFI